MSAHPVPTPQHALATLLRGTPLPWSSLAGDSAAVRTALAAEDLAPLVHHIMRDTPEFATWPSGVQEELRRRGLAAVAAELLVQRELIRVLDTLGERGVRPVLLKGTALAYTLYPHPSLRTRCDTDLLIRRADAPLVRETLFGLGFAEALQCDGEQLFRQFELVRRDSLGVVHALDFHWKISTQAAFADCLTYEELSEDAVPVPALGLHAAAPAAIHALLLALIHPVMHHRREERLIWVYDVHLLASQLTPADYHRFADRACEKRLSAICAYGLEASRHLFATPVPPEILHRLTRQPLAEQPTAAYLETGRTWAHETAANFRALVGWRDRLQLLREIALPSPAYLLRAYGVEGSGYGKALLPALYVHRGMRGLLRVLSGRK